MAPTDMVTQKSWEKLLVSRRVQVSIISHGSAGSSHCHVNISHILGSGGLGKMQQINQAHATATWSCKSEPA